MTQIDTILLELSQIPKYLSTSGKLPGVHVCILSSLYIKLKKILDSEVEDKIVTGFVVVVLVLPMHPFYCKIKVVIRTIYAVRLKHRQVTILEIQQILRNR